MNFPAAGKLIESIRVNAISREVRGGTPFIVKRRRHAAWPLVRVANLFFRAAKNPASVCERPEDWQRWESGCFEMLHGDRFRVRTQGQRTVLGEVLPGRSLVSHLEAGTFSEVMVEAAARELRRGHAMHSEEFHGPWSHGDPNLANFLFDTAEQRARLIDFEILHDRSLSAAERHAADLLVFLQDLLGCVSDENWLPMAQLFLVTYDCDAVLPFLKQQLVIPRGIPRLWWWIRTNYVSGAVLRERVARLSQTLS
ncbi:MAG: hypothetical protein QOD99_2419 [Chthoniobacter sp.]|jgi:hypothetical protein|nr:hypothetical protein [Chthoniobacter sp.]